MEFYAQIPKSQPPYTVIVHEENLAWQIKNVLSKEECDFFKQFALEVCGYKTPVENNPAQATFTSEGIYK